MGVDFKADITIFLFYAPENAELAQEIETYLKPFPNSLKVFHKNEIQVGDEFEKQIVHYLETAQIIIPLVSAQLNAWDEFYRMMEIIKDRHERKEVRIIPILADHCRIHQSLENLQPLPRDHSFLSNHKKLSPILTEIAQEIIDAISVILKRLHQTVTELYNRSIRWEEEGEYERQINELKDALRLIPKNPTLLDAISNAYFHTENYRQAIDSLTELLNLDPHHENAFKLLAIASFKQEDYAQALDAFETYLTFERSSTDMEALESYVACLIACGKKQDLYLPYYRIARIYHYTQINHNLAAKYYQLALAIAPTHFQLNLYFALFAYEYGLIDYYEKHAELAKNYAHPNQLREANEKLDNLEHLELNFEDLPSRGGIKEIRRFLKDKMKGCKELINSGKMDEAIRIYKVVLSLQSDDYHALMGLINTYNEKKKAPHIAVLYGKYAMEKKKGNKPLMYQYAKALIQTDLAKAQEVVSELLEQSPTNKSYLNLQSSIDQATKSH